MLEVVIFLKILKEYILRITKEKWFPADWEFSLQELFMILKEDYLLVWLRSSQNEKKWLIMG